LFPFSLSSREIDIDPESTGFLTMIGLNPENSRIGARMTNISAKAKQKP